VLEITIRRSKVKTGRTIFNKCRQIMAYADGVVIMGTRLEDVAEVFISLFEQSSKMGLEINERKTKYMIMSRRPYNENGYVEGGRYNFEYISWYSSNK
jgi:hypothetical protein